jgi:hypothetical protein
MAAGFHTAMLATASLAAAGGIIAWLTVSSDVLASASNAGGAAPVPARFSCDIVGAPLRPARDKAAV